MPGYSIPLEEGNARDYSCIICLLILRVPVQTSCGHRCCLSCVKEKRGSSGTFICPLDGTEVTEVFPDRFVEREILNLKCKCSFWRAGCLWIGCVREFEDHVSRCNFIYVPCGFCAKDIPKASLEEHASQCEQRLERCKDCGDSVKFSALRKHQQTTCPGTKIKCSHCGKDIFRGQLDLHLERECSEVPTPCSFAKIGCAATRPMKKNDKRKHMENAQVNHVTYLLTFALDLSQKLSQALESGAASGSSAAGGSGAALDMMDVEDITDTITEVQKYAQGLPAQGPPAQISNKRVRKIVSDSSAQQSSDQIFASLPSDLPSSSRQDNSLSKAMDEITGEITAIKVHLEDKLDRLSRNFDALKDSLKMLEKRFATADDVQRNIAVNMADLNERFDELENANYNGVLVWSITNFMKKRHDAIVGKNNSLYSPFFYTSPHGYKMRLRAYLNGDGMGKGTHISLFFVICMGKYDALLPWPFKHRVKLMMLDQDHEKDTVESFKPDPTSSSFQRPKKSMNIASGCPLFMSLSLLDTQGYVKDDTVFFKCEVDMPI